MTRSITRKIRKAVRYLWGWQQLLDTLDIVVAVVGLMAVLTLADGHLRETDGNLRATGGALLAALVFWYAAARILRVRYGHGRVDAARAPGLRYLVWSILITGLLAAAWCIAAVFISVHDKSL